LVSSRRVHSSIGGRFTDFARHVHTLLYTLVEFVGLAGWLAGWLAGTGWDEMGTVLEYECSLLSGRIGGGGSLYFVNKFVIGARIRYA